MHKIKLLCFASLLSASVSSAYATSTSVSQADKIPCNGFEIKIRNNLPNKLWIDNLNLQGAEIQPSGWRTIDAHTELVFTVNNSLKKVKMAGEFKFHTISIPSNQVAIKFNLKNGFFHCRHKDNASGGDYPVNAKVSSQQAAYAIG